MKIKHSSASSVKCWEQCQFKWCLQYNMEPRINLKQTYAADLGTHMHGVFEKIAKGELTKNNWLQWSKATQHKLYDLAKEKYPDCDCIKERVELDCIEIFNFLFKRDPIFNPLENPLIKILDSEKKFEYNIGNEVRIKGFMDLVIELDNETLEIVDWKTGKSAMSFEKALKDIQVLMYYMAARHLYPQYKYVIITLDYLRHKPVSLPLDDNCCKRCKRILFTTLRQIRTCKKPQRWQEPIWVCKCFCDRGKCDELWNIYQNKCGGSLNKFKKYMSEGVDNEICEST